MVGLPSLRGKSTPICPAGITPNGLRSELTDSGELPPPLEDLEVALLGLDDVVQQGVDRRDLPVLVELVVERGELHVVLEAEDLHQVVRPATVFVDRDVPAADRVEQRLQRPPP